MGLKLPWATVGLAEMSLAVHAWWVQLWGWTLTKSSCHLSVLAHAWFVRMKVFLHLCLDQECKSGYVCICAGGHIWSLHTWVYLTQAPTVMITYVYIYTHSHSHIYPHKHTCNYINTPLYVCIHITYICLSISALVHSDVCIRTL